MPASWYAGCNLQAHRNVMFSSLLAESSWRIALDRNTIVVMLVLNAELHNNRALVEGKPHLLLQGFTATPCSLSHLHCWPSALAKLLKPKDPSSARRRPGNLLFRAFAFSMTRALSTGTSADQIHWIINGVFLQIVKFSGMMGIRLSVNSSSLELRRYRCRSAMSTT